MKRVALLGEFTPTFTPHVATNHAIEHSIKALGLSISASWVSTGDIDEGFFRTTCSDLGYAWESLQES
jgi:hypothetical protein